MCLSAHTHPKHKIDFIQQQKYFFDSRVRGEPMSNLFRHFLNHGIIFGKIFLWKYFNFIIPCQRNSKNDII